MARLAWLVVGAISLAALFTVAGCGSDGGSQDPAAVEGSWRLVEASAEEIDVNLVDITADFGEGQVSGVSGVNSYRGPYSAESGGSFEAGPLSSTLMAGPESHMAAEAAYIDLLQRATMFELDGDTLTLTTDDGGSLAFEGLEPVQLPGTSWSVTGYNNGKGGVVSVAAASELTLDFGDDGTVSGNAGVNTFSGEYDATVDTIRIGPLVSTKKAGPQELMDQEAAYLAALEATTQWDVLNGRLTLRDAEGATQVTAMPR